MTLLNRTASLTDVGQRRLEQELTWLRRDMELAYLEVLYRESGDHDTGQYQIAVQELERIRARMEELQTRSVRSGKGAAAGVITMGSRVTARDESGDDHVFVLVSPLEAGSASGHISTESPVGAALLGSVSGETVRAVTPRGQRAFEVVSVE